MLAALSIGPMASLKCVAVTSPQGHGTNSTRAYIKHDQPGSAMLRSHQEYYNNNSNMFAKFLKKGGELT